jgi:hypothetical protein
LLNLGVPSTKLKTEKLDEEVRSIVDPCDADRVDVAKLRRLCGRFGLPSQTLRARTFQILLGVLPAHLSQWEAAATEMRDDLGDVQRTLAVLKSSASLAGLEEAPDDEDEDDAEERTPSSSVTSSVTLSFATPQSHGGALLGSLSGVVNESDDSGSNARAVQLPPPPPPPPPSTAAVGEERGALQEEPEVQRRAAAICAQLRAHRTAIDCVAPLPAALSATSVDCAARAFVDALGDAVDAYDCDAYWLAYRFVALFDDDARSVAGPGGGGSASAALARPAFELRSESDVLAALIKRLRARELRS